MYSHLRRHAAILGLILLAVAATMVQSPAPAAAEDSVSAEATAPARALDRAKAASEPLLGLGDGVMLAA